MSQPQHRQRRARPAAGIALVAALALTATACGDSGSGDSGGEGSGKGKIVFWDNNGGVRTDVWKQIIAAFEKKYPDIQVEYVGIPIADVQKKYDTAIAGGGLPDVGGVGTAYLANMVAQNALEPVGDRIDGSDLKGKLVTGMVTSVQAAGGQGKEMYEVPTSANQGTIWYRTDLFSAAGLQPPTTWSAFYAAADKLTAASDNKFGFTIRGGKGSIAQALEMMYAQSGIESFWDGDKTTVNDPKNIAALEKYVGLYKKATPEADLNNDFVNMVAEFDHGNVGMLQHNLGSYNDHVKALGKDKVDGIPLPPSQDGGVRTIVSNPVDGLGLFKSGKNKAAAWKFIEFAASAPMNSLWSQSAASIPANTGAEKDQWINESKPTKVAMDSLNDPKTKIVQFPYYLPDWNTITKADTEPDFQKVLLGKMTAKEFADELAGKLNDAQADFAQHNKK
ncbi:ABC transporter substrate-binding protein [Actinacidiphila bryophytorum]|uniref:Secreted sugar-binding protein n=2 Tax=Actinacidiphila bryophytorum TaxID=1436133 RepID=A0A9W4H321_9ACTN|nr:sugar ABC transporter substrate-binding protein [Actinacidiphila bryophytorum]MBM9437144.1 sugar ABC transporter substrate-binding protein [Actinacidiphila bryophytorum]CAG7646837.1 putative secreted sugar-binding protein [Actinacidiphila bryophytorum]